MSIRLDGWLEALHALVETHRFHAQEWGSWDCCQFAAEVVLAQTGRDYRTEFPLYGSEAEAQEILEEHGGMVGLLSSVLGPAVHISRAQRGDIVCRAEGICAVCLGVMCAAPGPLGLRFAPTAEAIAAWRIE